MAGKNIQRGYVNKNLQIYKEKICGTMPKVIRKNSSPNAQDVKKINTRVQGKATCQTMCLCVHPLSGLFHNPNRF